MKYIIPTLFISSFAFLACSAPAEKTERSFTDNMRTHCGQAFAGRMVTDDPEDELWANVDIKMHMFDCAEDDVKIALHVGEHRSMTWIVSGEGEALALQHDHRQKDGSAHPFTDFGGTAEAVTQTRAEFRVTPESVGIFETLGLPDPDARTWALEVQAESGVLAYERQRPEHFFRLEFDTTTPISTPPTPWGW